MVVNGRPNRFDDPEKQPLPKNIRKKARQRTLGYTLKRIREKTHDGGGADARS